MLFSDVASAALSNRCRTKNYKNAKSFQRWETVTAKHLIPHLGALPVEEIDSEIIVKTLSELWTTHTPTACMARAVLDYIMGYAIHKRWRSANDYNPAKWKDCLSFDLPPPADIHTVEHHEAATVGELQKIMPKLMASNKIGQIATAFGILTAGRSSEYTQAKWSEIDLANRVFLVPPARCKIKRQTPFEVPLSTQAIELLSSIERTSEFVFTSKMTGRAISTFAPRQVMQAMLPNHAGVTAHGNRATFSTWCAESGKDPTLREMSLMHAVGNQVARAYDRSAALDQRRLLMQQWADAIYHA